MRVQILLWFQCSSQNPIFRPFFCIQKHLFKHFRLFQTFLDFFSQMLSHPFVWRVWQYVKRVDTLLCQCHILKFDDAYSLYKCEYAVKVQRSLAPLSWFPGSRKPTAHVHQWCRFQSYAKSRRLHAIANEIYKQNLHCVNRIPGIHDNGPPRTTLWRLTLKALVNIVFDRFKKS